MNHRLTLGDSDYTEGQKQEGFTADGVDFAGTEDHSVLGGFETRPTVRCCINSMMQERIALLSRLITPREGGRGTEAIKRILVGAAMVLATAGGVAVGQIQWEPHTIAGGEFSAIDASCVFAIDLDGDGDTDILSASSDDNKIAWYENDGLEDFTQYIISSQLDEATSVFAADIDNDDDIDVLSSSFWDFRVTWYENLMFTGISDISLSVPLEFGLGRVYPSPFNTQTTIPFTLGRAGRVKLEIFDITGRNVGAFLQTPLHGRYSAGMHEVVWNAEGLSSGVYLVRLQQQRTGTLLHETRKAVLVK